MLLNLAARGYGDAAVAGMSIVSRIFMFIISVAIGVGQGLQPVASFNYGARKYRRVRQAAIFTIEAAFCMLVVLVGLCVEICQPIADVLTFLVSLPFLLAFLQQLGRMDDAEQSKTAS